MNWNRPPPEAAGLRLLDDCTFEDLMAKKTAEPHPPTVAESAMDYAQHEKTYNGFVQAVKWSVYATAALMIILYFVINP